MSSSESQSAKKVPERLPSLRGIRDLTLKDAGLSSAAASKKRTFTPVLPSQAKVKAQTDFVSEFEPPPELKMKPGFIRNKSSNPEMQQGSGRGRGRGRGRGQEHIDESQFVQMKSVFAEGPMQRQDAFIKSGYHGSYGSSREGQSSYGGGSGGGGGGGGGGSGSRTKLGGTVKGEDAMDWKDDVASLLDELLRDDFIADAASSVNDEMAPVVLPFSGRQRKEMKGSAGTSKSDIKVKEEPMSTTDAVDADVLERDLASQQPSEIFGGTAVQNDHELMLIQLPDVLPGVPFEKALHSRDNASSGDQTFLLSDFEEGCVGQLVVRRSGKTQLVLNNIVFDVVAGTKANFLQELVSLQTPEDSSAETGLLSVLGHVRHKLLCVPDLDQLLNVPQSASAR